jgi:hypothetical protein
MDSDMGAMGMDTMLLVMGSPPVEVMEATVDIITESPRLGSRTSNEIFYNKPFIKCFIVVSFLGPGSSKST